MWFPITVTVAGRQHAVHVEAGLAWVVDRLAGLPSSSPVWVMVLVAGVARRPSTRTGHAAIRR